MRAFTYASVCISCTLYNSPIKSGLKILRRAVSGEHRLLEGRTEIRARRKVNLWVHSGTAQELPESREDAEVGI